MHTWYYGVASMSRLLQIIGLFCRTESLLQGSFTKETSNFQEPTNRSDSIGSTSPKTFLHSLVDFKVLSHGWRRSDLKDHDCQIF